MTYLGQLDEYIITRKRQFETSIDGGICQKNVNSWCYLTNIIVMRVKFKCMNQSGAVVVGLTFTTQLSSSTVHRSIHVNTFTNTFFSGDWKQQSVDNNWTSFKSHVLDIISKHVPYKLCSNRLKLPWLTPQLRKPINKRNKLYFKARRTKQPELWAKYKTCKRETQNTLRKAEWMHMNDIIMSCHIFTCR